MTVFISHSHEDLDVVLTELVPLLESHNVGTWVSTVAVESASAWERSVLAGLRSADALAVLLTPRAVASKWVRAEVAWWLDEKYDPGKRNLIPIVLEDCDWKDVHVMMRSIQSIRCVGPGLQSLDCRGQIVSVFGAHLRRQAVSSNSELIVDVEGPLLDMAVEFYPPSRPPNNWNPIRYAVSPTHHWEEGTGLVPLADLVRKTLGLADGSEVGLACCVADQPQRGLAPMILFEGGLCFFAGQRTLGKVSAPGAALLMPTLGSPTHAAVLFEGGLICGYHDGSLVHVTWNGRVREVVTARGTPILGIGSSERTTLVVAWEDGHVEVRASVNPTVVKRTLQIDDEILCLLCHNPVGDQSYFAVGCKCGDIAIYDFDGERLSTLTSGRNPIIGLSAHPHHSRLLASSAEELSLWSVRYRSGSGQPYLDYVVPLERRLSKSSVAIELPVPGTRPQDQIDSFLVLANGDGEISSRRLSGHGASGR